MVATAQAESPSPGQVPYSDWATGADYQKLFNATVRSGKVLDKLPDLLKRMREMLVRFLGTVQAASQRGTRRLAGIDLNKARNRHVADAVVALSTRPGGFTLAQAAEAVQQRAGRSLKAYSARNAAYDLAKLKGKKLVHRVKGSRRYKADPFRRPGYVRLPHPARQGYQTAACRCRASLWPTAKEPNPGRSTLRPAPRGTQPNLPNHRPCGRLRNSQHSDNMLAFVVRLAPSPFSRFHWKREVRCREQLPDAAANSG
jgi:hypothetical protein